MQPTPRKRAASRITSSLDGGISAHNRTGKRRQHNSPYVSQGAACCSICLDMAVQLVQLGACPHAVCRGCMASHLLHAFKLGHLPLRCPLPQCKARLRLQPAVQLMEQQVPGSKALAAKVLLAGADPLSVIPDDLCLACPYKDCQVPMELDLAHQLPDVPSDCPTCNRPICATCKSTWHTGMLCAEYKALIGSKRPGTFGCSSQPQCPQQQQVPLISAAAGFSSSWQQQQQHQDWQQKWQQQAALLPRINVACTAAAPGNVVGWQCETSSPLCLQDAGCDDGMSWSPAKNV